MTSHPAPRASQLAPRAAHPDLLATIAAAARRITEVRAETIPLAMVETAAANRRPDGAGFLRALRDGASPRVIAECKRRSPSRGILREDYDAADHARAYAAAGAAAISVLTEPTFFDGALAHLAAVRAAVKIPVLRKDFIVTRYQVLEAVMAGADAILLIVGALTPAGLRDLLDVASQAGAAALVEIHDEDELAMAADAGAEIIGVNGRNLRTLSVEPPARPPRAEAAGGCGDGGGEWPARDRGSAAARARRLQRVPRRRTADRAASTRAGARASCEECRRDQSQDLRHHDAGGRGARRRAGCSGDRYRLLAEQSTMRRDR